MSGDRTDEQREVSAMRATAHPVRIQILSLLTGAEMSAAEVGGGEMSAEDLLLRAGRELYTWADQQSGNYDSLRIRTRVTEPYVTRGSFHILADAAPEPRVYWHPRFLNRLGQLLGVAQ